MYSLHKIAVSVLFLYLSSSVHCGDPYRIPPGADGAGMGSVCIMRDAFWASFHNQALLAGNNHLSAGINYENRFFISELGTRSGALIIPAGGTSLGLIYSRFGYTHFKRELAGLACGMAFSDVISAGIQIDYFAQRSSGEYDKRQALSFEAGLLITPDENVRIGIHVFNPVPSSLIKSFLPSSLGAGAGIILGKDLFIGAEAEMCTGYKLIARTGFEYLAFKQLNLRGGFSTENTSFSFGLGYCLESVHLDLSFSTHENLGITSSASLVFILKK